MTRREPLITKEKFRRTGCCRRFSLRIPGELDYQIWEGAGSRLSGRNRTRKRGNRRIDTKSGQSGFRNGSRPKGPAPVEAARIAARGEVSREERIEIRWTASVRHDTNDMIAARRCGGAPPAGGNRQPDCRPAAATRTLAKQARVTWPPQGKRRDRHTPIAPSSQSGATHRGGRSRHPPWPGHIADTRRPALARASRPRLFSHDASSTINASTAVAPTSIR